MKVILKLFLLLFLISCNQDQAGFNFLNDVIEDQEDLTIPPSEIEIVDYTPKADPVVLTANSERTFAVTVNNGAGENIAYTFLLDDVAIENENKSFIELSGNDFSEGIHVLKVTVANESSKAEHLFNIRKNSRPALASSTPNSAGNSVTCSSGQLNLEVVATDSDSDQLTFNWLLDGVARPSLFSIVTNGGVSRAEFRPSCVYAGLKNISVEIYDGYEATTQSWSVDVINPQIATIQSFTPVETTVVIQSTGSKLFSVSATGKDPLAYEWYLDNVLIANAEDSFYTVTAGSLSTGPHTLKAKVLDADSDDEHEFSLIKNAPPSIDSFSPASLSQKINFRSTVSFSVDVSDANSDNIDFIWKLNGITSSYIESTVSGNSSQAVFAPTELILGNHDISVTISDGIESVTKTWSVGVNRFSDQCNSLLPGRICTLVGPQGIGSGLTLPDDISRTYIRPVTVIEDDEENYFFADADNHVIWFVNMSGSFVRRLGVDVPPEQAVVLVGNGVGGTTTEGFVRNNYKLDSPRGLAWDPVTESLFVADFNNNRIVRIDEDGVGRRVICRGDTTSWNAPAQHVTDGPALNHSCYHPYGLALDVTNRFLYVSNYDGASIKRFNISNADYNNWTGRVYVGRGPAAGNITAGNADGPIFAGVPASDASVTNPRYLSLDSSGRLYWFDGNTCKIRVANPNGATSFFNGTVPVGANQVKTLTSAVCAATAAEVDAASYAFAASAPIQVAPLENGSGGVLGFFTSNYAYHTVPYLNNINSLQSFGGRDIPGLKGHIVFGKANSGLFNGDVYTGINTNLNNPAGIVVSSEKDKLLVADYNNSRIRRLDLDTGEIDTIIGNGKYLSGWVGDGTTTPQDTQLNDPTSVSYNSQLNAVMYSDRGNGRIRSIDLATGNVTTLLAAGVANSGSNDQFPGDVRLNQSRGHWVRDGVIFYVDGPGNDVSNDRNCFIKAYNTNQISKTVFGVVVNAGKVTTIVGDYSAGCKDWQVAWNGLTGLNVRLREPEDIIISNNELLISNFRSHCILRVEPDGRTYEYIGKCGTPNDVETTIASGNVRISFPAAMTLDPNPTYSAFGNFFFVDRSDQATSKIKYVNRSSTETVTINGIDIPPGNVVTVYTTGGYTTGIAAMDQHVCYTSGQVGAGGNGAHNVTCHDRNSDVGNITLRVGPMNASTIKAGRPLGSEQEGLNAPNATLYAPYDLTFDASGNLYISERSNHLIRMVKRWW